MKKTRKKGARPEEKTGVDDVRRVREKIAARYRGDFQRHMEDTRAIVEPLIEKLGLKRVSPGKPTRPHSRTGS
jgi:hypothetical protein